jgi:hypothetical protein
VELLFMTLPPEPLLLPPLLQERVKHIKIPTRYPIFFIAPALPKKNIGNIIRLLETIQSFFSLSLALLYRSSL